MAAPGSPEGIERLAAFIRAESGARAVDVRNVRQLAGGSSRQVWAVDVSLGEDAPLRLALRLDATPQSAEPGLAASAGGFAGEFGLLRAMHARGAPVPRVYWTCGDVDVLGGPFYLMDRVEGETIPRRLFRAPELADARAALPAQLGRALARIHAADLVEDRLDWLPAPAPGQSCPEMQLASIRAGADAAASPSPTLELAYRWLERSKPAERGRTLVHGDYRIGNVVVGPEGLRAILDWELAHVGDPHEDLAWMCTKTWRFGNVEQPVGGVGQREPFYAAYEAESGRKLDRDALHYWEVLGSAKVCVVWIFQLRAYLTGARPTVEHAAIGRRLSETEWDLLELLRAM